VLIAIRIEIESRRIRHIAARSVRHNCDVIAYLALVRVAFKRVEGLTYRYVSRPGNAAIGTPGIK